MPIIFHLKNVRRKERLASIFRSIGKMAGLPRQGFKYQLRADSVADAVGLET